MSKKVEIIGIKFRKTKIIEIHALGNKIFEIPFNKEDFETEKAYVFSENISKQAEIMLSMFMKK